MKQISALNSNVRKLLKFTALQYMLDTVHENPKLAKIFVDDADNPSSCIVSFHHLTFLGGNPTEDCLRFLSDKILVKDSEKSWQVFFMIYPDEVWKDALKGVLPENYSEYERSLYRYKPEYIEGQSYSDNIVEITPELIKSAFDNLDMLIEEVSSTGTYDNLEDYFLRGFGYTPIIDNKICGFCTSEYPSKNAVAIGIEVLEEYQRHGYAKAMTKCFLNKAVRRNLSVYWECWKNNIASASTALSCGFEKAADYPILFVKL